MVFLFRQFYYRYEQFFSFVSDQSDVGRHLTAVGRLSDKKCKSFILLGPFPNQNITIKSEFLEEQ